MTPTCLHCLSNRKTITQGSFTGTDGRKVPYGVVECASKGRTGIIKMIDCREPGAAVDANAEGR